MSDLNLGSVISLPFIADISCKPLSAITIKSPALADFVATPLGVKSAVVVNTPSVFTPNPLISSG